MCKHIYVFRGAALAAGAVGAAEEAGAVAECEEQRIISITIITTELINYLINSLIENGSRTSERLIVT